MAPIVIQLSQVDAMKQINALQIARYLVASAHQKGTALTNMEVSKLLYYTQGWFLALYGQPLFQEKIRAWKQGPVVASVHGHFEHYGRHPINPSEEAHDISEPVRLHLERIVETFGKASASHLKAMTIAEQPWIKAREGYPPHESSDTEILVKDMREYFLDLIRGAPVEPQYRWGCRLRTAGDR